MKNSYRIESETGETSAWNMEKISKQMNWLYSTSRNKTNGAKTYKSRKFGPFVMQRGERRWQTGFEMQDTCRRDWMKIEATGHLPRLYIETEFGSVYLNNELAQFFIDTSEIANLRANGWFFKVE